MQDLLAWAEKTVIINNQHKAEIITICKEWLIGHGYKFPKVQKPETVPVAAKTKDEKQEEPEKTVDNDPYYRYIDMQVEELNAARRQREAEKTLSKYKKPRQVKEMPSKSEEKPAKRRKRRAKY